MAKKATRYHCASEKCKVAFAAPSYLRGHYKKFPSHRKKVVVRTLPLKTKEVSNLLIRYCIECGIRIDTTWKFCGVCGTKIRRPMTERIVRKG